MTNSGYKLRDPAAPVFTDENGLVRDKRFDAYVDELHGELEICGQSIAPSDALATDHVRYGDAYRTWMLQCEQELRDLVVESFPQPIAHSFRRFLKGWRTQHDRFEALRDTWEAVVHILFSLALGELRAGDHVVEDTEVDRRWVESQTLRERVELVSQVAIWGGELLSVTAQISEQSIADLLHLIQHRNDVAHRAARTGAQVARELDDVVPVAMHMLSDLRWLADWEFMRPTGEMRDGQAEFQRLQGHSADLEYTWRQISEQQRRALVLRPSFQREIFAFNGQSAIGLAPMLHLVFEEDSHHARIAVLKKRQGKRFVYEIVGRSQNVEIENASLVASIQELKALFVKTGQVKR